MLASYEYSCPKCNTRVVKQRSISSDDPGYTCETCKSDLIRVYYPIGVTFNGSGFYSTDKGR
jgi:putative FmdB family regulatory protein